MAGPTGASNAAQSAGGGRQAGSPRLQRPAGLGDQALHRRICRHGAWLPDLSARGLLRSGARDSKLPLIDTHASENEAT